MATINNIIKHKIELLLINTRIDELERSKVYYTLPQIYRNRMNKLLDKKEEILAKINGKSISRRTPERLVLELSVPESAFRSEKVTPDEILQYFVKENISIIR